MRLSISSARLMALLGLVSLAFASVTLASAQQRNPGLINNTGDPTQSQIDAHNELTGEAKAQRAAALLSDHGMPATVLQCELRKDLSTRNAKAGDEVVLAVRKPTTFPGGVALGRGTLIIGHVVQAAAHTKTYPNGAMLLTFDALRVKNADAVVPIFALIVGIAPSESEQHSTTGAIHEGTIGGTSNSPNASIMQQGGAGDAVIGQGGVVNGIDGVMLVASAGGSGVLVAPNNNAGMYATQEMMLVAGPATGGATAQRAYALLHPAKTAAPAH